MSTDALPLSHVNVWRVEEDLVVTWRGGSADTSIFVSESSTDPGVDVRGPDEPGQVTISGVGRQRVYLHLFEPGHGFTVTAERRVELEGTENFRDLGGYETAVGVTRWERVFRADVLAGLTGPDHEMLERLGIDRVFDLRSETEVELAPDRLPAGVEYEHRPLSSDVAQRRDLFQRIMDGELPSFTEDDMTAGYLRMLDAYQQTFADVVHSVADGETIVFHCSAGKDRTGLMAMVLLSLAGVDDANVLDDYELTGRFRRDTARAGIEETMRQQGLDPDDFATMWQAPRPVMRRTVEGLRDRWGDVVRYLTEAGVDTATLDAAHGELNVQPDA